MTRRTIAAIVGLALAWTALTPQAADAADPAAAAALRARGLESGYNLDYDAALAAFKDAIAADPNHPAAYRLTAATTWIRALFEQGAITVDDYLGQARASVERKPPSTALDTAFHESISRAIAISEAQLRQHPSDADLHYQVGAAYGYLASYTASIDGRLIGSLGAARRAYHEHERALELEPRRKDAGLVVGLYDYTIASLSAPLRLLAHLAGFGGDRERALHRVEEAARYPSDAQPNALFTLILIYNREGRPDAALHVISELQQRFPRNRLLWLEAGNTALRAGRPAEARTAIERGLAMAAHDSRPHAFGEDARWKFAHGAALAALDDPAAEGELRAALALSRRDWLSGRAHSALGTLAVRSGNRDRAAAEYRLAERLCRQDRDDDCANDARRLLTNTSHRN
jgi:tetratricopeptide (TPR) repeat protein